MVPLDGSGDHFGRFAGKDLASIGDMLRREQSFLSAASGIAVAIALVRGFARRNAQTIGNFWADMVRATLYVLLPVCVPANEVMSLASPFLSGGWFL